MNVVGKVGSLISQGVYSVATPFHPFGGAVDIIVVQQQDGTFRSTPWYVRFGKFQGVLKGAEKVVRITVNGIEADFHMYLDNSGEAYFVREVDSCIVREANGDVKISSDGEVIEENGNNDITEFCRLEHSLSDPGMTKLREECVAATPKRLERAESDTRFYEFQDEQSSLEDSVNLSEFGSGRYEGLDAENLGEAQNSDSEVVLVSVDGHVLTAPVLASEQSAENVQLSTPRFHLGPGEETDFCEGNEEFTLGDNVWAADQICKLNSVADTDSPDDICHVNSDSTALTDRPEVCEEGREHTRISEETHKHSHHETEIIRESNAEDASIHKKKGDVFKSCLELSELVRNSENADAEGINSSSEAQVSQAKPPFIPLEVDENEDGAIGDFRNKDGLLPSCHSISFNNNGSPDSPVQSELIGKKVLDTDYMGSNGASVDSVDNDPEWKHEQYGISSADEGIHVNTQSPAPEYVSKKSETGENETSCKDVDTHTSSGFDISLCANELYAGMGLDAAAEVFEAHRISEEEYKNSSMSIINDENLIIRFGEKYFTWEKAAPIVLGMAAFGVELAVEPQDAIPVEQDKSSNQKDDDSVVGSSSSGRRWRLWPIPFRRVKTLEHSNSNSSSEEVFVDTEPGLQNFQADLTPAPSGRTESPHKQYIRTNVPTSEQIASLHLKDGQNMITFSFSTRVLGTQQVDAHLYLWKWNAKIVISDVDGTITKSDVLGQFMPLVGRDWTQSGVAKLFSAIKENGYQLLFLSARAIVQAYITRNFLLNLKQDGKPLPNGPVVISPDGLFPSLFREVIRRAPHEFKIACLEDIKKLFPSDYNPFYAGFGNRDTDELSYRKIGIPKGKIFIINPKGEVAVSHFIDVRTYTSLHTLVNDMFPPTSLVEQEDFNNWNFWKMPLPDID